MRWQWAARGLPGLTGHVITLNSVSKKITSNCANTVAAISPKCSWKAKGCESKKNTGVFFYCLGKYTGVLLVASERVYMSNSSLTWHPDSGGLRTQRREERSVPERRHKRKDPIRKTFTIAVFNKWWCCTLHKMSQNCWLYCWYFVCCG